MAKQGTAGHGRGGLPARNYYVPMTDLLAGLVFILIIVLQAVALVARDDFARSDDILREARAIEARLQRLREIEATAIRPREQTEESLRLVLEALAADLRGRNLPATVLPDGRSLTIAVLPLASEAGLAPEMRTTAAALGSALTRWLPCLTPARPASCPGSGAPEIMQVQWTVLAPAGGAAGSAAAAGLYAELATLDPALALATNRDGAPLLDVRGGAASGSRIDLAFGIRRTALPVGVIEIGPR